MANPKKTSPIKQKPTAKKKSLPKKKPAKAMPAKPAKKVSAPKKTAAKKHDTKPVVKKAAKVKKPLVKKESSQHSSTKKSAKPVKAAAPARAEKTVKADRKHKQPSPAQQGKAAKGVTREIDKGKDEAPAGGNKRDQLRNRILVDHKKAYKPVAFTLEEAREIAKQHAHAAGKSEENTTTKTTVQSKANSAKLAKAAAPTHVKAASLADILGFNPKRAKPTIFAPVESVPEKYRRYYKELLELRASLTEGLTLHSEETLRRSTKEDAGDLSSYGQHMADAGTDTFDRDFALSMVANEQEALSEIDAAIKRIQNGTYGVCEITNKPISKDRLLAVPFTRYSAEAQKDLERNRMRVRTAAGLFGGEINDDNGRVDDSGGGDAE